MHRLNAKVKHSGYLALILAVFFIASRATTIAQEVQTFVSSKAGDRLTRKPALHFEQYREASPVAVTIDDTATHQRMDGFGASFLEAGLICLNSLPPKERDSVLRALFD